MLVLSVCSSMFWSHGFGGMLLCDGDDCCHGSPEAWQRPHWGFWERLQPRWCLHFDFSNLRRTQFSGSETWPSYSLQCLWEIKETDEDLCKRHLWKQKTWEYSEKQLYLTCLRMAGGAVLVEPRVHESEAPTIEITVRQEKKMQDMQRLNTAGKETTFGGQ